jgi:nucleoside-diphosphate-sugar epimerase
MVIANVELSHFYGPGDDKTKFVSNMLDMLIREVPMIPLTEGEQVRDFIYIDDVVDAFSRIMEHVFSLKNGFYEFQVCEGARVSVKELVRELKRALGNSSTVLNFGALPYREHEAMKPTGSSAALSALGWQPSYSLEEGIKVLVELERGATDKNN